MSFSILLSCNNDDNSNQTPVNLPVVIDYHQVVGEGESGNGPILPYFRYEQDGLTVEIIDFRDQRPSFYYVQGVGDLWLYPGSLKISNIDALEGLSKISYDQINNPIYTSARLYDSNDNIIKEFPFDQPYPIGGYVFDTNLDQASYLIIEAYENEFTSIVFE